MPAATCAQFVRSRSQAPPDAERPDGEGDCPRVFPRWRFRARTRRTIPRTSVVIHFLSRSDLRVIEERGLPHYCRRPKGCSNAGANLLTTSWVGWTY